MTKAKLFAWDFHGTLEEGVEVGFYEIVKSLQADHPTNEKITLPIIRKLYGMSVGDYLNKLFPGKSVAEIKRMMAKIAKAQNQEHLRKFVTPAPHAVKVLEKISKFGHINIIISNSHPDHINPLIEIVGIGGSISEVFAVDRHYSHEKFDPVIEKIKSIKKFVESNNISEVIVIGDRPQDIKAGVGAGALTYQYARKGFPKFKTDADFVISDLRKVLKEI